MVCELVLLEVGEDDGCEGGEEGGAFVYRAVVDSIPYLCRVSFDRRERCWTYCLGASFEYGGAIETLVVFYGVAVLDDAFGAAERWRGIVRRQRIRVYLYSHRSRRVLSRTDFVQPEHLARGIVEFVMVDFDVCESGIELNVDITQPGRKLEGGHGGR